VLVKLILFLLHSLDYGLLILFVKALPPSVEAGLIL